MKFLIFLKESSFRLIDKAYAIPHFPENWLTKSLQKSMLCYHSLRPLFKEMITSSESESWRIKSSMCKFQKGLSQGMLDQ